MNKTGIIFEEHELIGKRVEIDENVKQKDGRRIEKTFEATIMGVGYCSEKSEYYFLILFDDNDIATRRANKCRIIKSSKRAGSGSGAESLLNKRVRVKYEEHGQDKDEGEGVIKAITFNSSLNSDLKKTSSLNF